jgi:ribonuclease R
LVTIDGADARDFDDAVAASKTSNGYILYVAIADVSHYVKENTELDRLARDRSTSIYLPDRAIHMLPEVLSAGACSLKPHEDRLALVAEITLSKMGEASGSKFYEATIRSQKRFTYEEVEEFFYNGAPPPALARGIVESMRLLVEISELLRRKRLARGSLDFNLAEAQAHLNGDGEVREISRRERLMSHRLIEECMLAANEAVARFFRARDLDTIFRVHAPPDEEKLAGFHALSASMGLKTNAQSSKELNAFLAKISGKPYERSLNQLLLRAMMQAVYSHKNTGHFALASGDYLHFTSPIRRYPDLVVHRMLKKALNSRRAKPMPEEELAGVAEHCSQRERRAMEIEREVMDLCRTLLVKDRLGESFQVRVCAVMPFGLFVEAEEPYIGGLAPISALGGDRYIFDEMRQHLLGARSGFTFSLGDKLEVILSDVNVAKRQLTFMTKAGQRERGKKRAR